MRSLATLVLAGLAVGLFVAVVATAVRGGGSAAAPGPPAAASATSTSGGGPPPARTPVEVGTTSTSAGQTAPADEHTDGHREDPPARNDGAVRVTVWPAGSMTPTQARTLGEGAWAELERDLRSSGQRTWSAWQLDAIRVDTSPVDGPHVHLIWTATRAADGRPDVQTTRWPWKYPSGLDGR